MFKRRRIRKLVKNSVTAAVLISGIPTVDIESIIEDQLPEDAWNAVIRANFDKVVHDPIIVDAISEVIKKRLKPLIEDVTDLLEDRIEYSPIRCDVCGSRLFTVLAIDVSATRCPKCYNKQKDAEGTEQQVPNGPGAQEIGE